MKRLAIVTTHPIQYYAPVFRLLAEQKNAVLRVFYTWGIQSQNKYDPGFGKTIEWDIPLLEGYDHVFVHNTSPDPGSHHFRGIVNPALLQEVSAWQPDAVLIYGWNYHSHLRLMRKLKGEIPIWFRGDSHLLDPIPWWKRILKKAVLSTIYRYIDLAFYVGTQNKRYYQAFGLREKQLVFAPHAIDNDRFRDEPGKDYAAQAASWRAELGFRPEDIVVLFVGKFEAKKNPQLLLRAIQKHNLLPGKVQLKLLLVGNGVLEDQLVQQALNDPNILFIAFQNQSQMPVVYRLGNVLCLPSAGPGETWGLAINEAMASGLPVIVSARVGCAPDLVQMGKTGFIFSTDQEDALMTILHQLSSSDLKAMGHLAKTSIEDWSFEKQMAAIIHQLHD